MIDSQLAAKWFINRCTSDTGVGGLMTLVSAVDRAPLGQGISTTPRPAVVVSVQATGAPVRYLLNTARARNFTPVTIKTQVQYQGTSMVPTHAVTTRLEELFDGGIAVTTADGDVHMCRKIGDLPWTDVEGDVEYQYVDQLWRVEATAG